jgi:hypothetical protein
MTLLIDRCYNSRKTKMDGDEEEHGHRRLTSLSSLLSQYYGRVQEGTETPRAADASNIDSARFDQNRYVKKLLDEQPLEELMKRDQKLTKGNHSK